MTPDVPDMPSDMPSDNSNTPRRRRPRDLRHARTQLPDDMLFVALYCRVSDPKQARADKTSLAEQEAKCRARAEDIARRSGKALHIVGVWKDDFTGTTESADRPQFGDLLRVIESGKVGLVIAYKLDRLWRNDTEAELIRERWEKSFVRIATCEAEYRYKESGNRIQMHRDDKLMFKLKAHFAAQERDDILQRSEDGREGQAKTGRQPIRAHNPYGYRITRKWEVQAGLIPVGADGHYLIIEEQAEVVRLIFSLASEGISPMKICEALHEKRIPSPRGNATWRERTIRDIIHDPLYMGIGQYRRTHRYKDPERIKDGYKPAYTVKADPTEIITFPAPAIVDKELWEKVQEVSSTNRSRLSGNPATRYLLTGLVKCPLCGCSMCGQAGGRMKENPAQRTRYYLCSKRSADRRRAAHDETPRCGQPFINAVMFETQVAKALEECVTTGQINVTSAIRLFQEEVTRQSASGGRITNQKREALISEIQKANKAHETASQAILRVLGMDPEADISSFIAEQVNARNTKRELEAQLEGLQETIETPSTWVEFAREDPDALSLRVTRALSMIHRVITSPHQSLEKKRQVLDSMIEYIKPTTKAGSGKTHVPVKWGAEVRLRPVVYGMVAGKSVHGDIGTSGKPRTDTPDTSPLSSSTNPLTYQPLPATLTLTITHDQEVSCRVAI